MTDLGLDAEQPVVLFCQHSVTTESDAAVEQVRPSLEALRGLAAEGYQIVITYPNNDAGGRRIIEELASVQGIPGIQVHESLGRAQVPRTSQRDRPPRARGIRGELIGRIKETPVFGCPVVNIGSRQQGRLRGSNVLDAPYEASAIREAIVQCATDEAFREHCRVAENPYGSGDAGRRIADVLATIPIDGRLLQKKMTY